jgi:hypothetical protein
VRRAALVVVAVLGVGAADARASFTPPVALSGPSPIEVSGAADTDAAGTTTTLVGGSRLAVRPRGGAWSAPARFPGRPAGAVGAVLDAAGAGALGIAWRVDRPRRYAGIGVALRDPGGALSDPIATAGGRAVLAWSFVAGRRQVGVQAAVGPVGAPGPPQTVADITVPSRFFLSEPHVAATIDPQGPATVLFGQPSPAPNDAGLQWRLVAADAG